VLALYAAFARMRPPKAGDLPALALLGFPVFGAFAVFLGYGQQMVPASTASLLVATNTGLHGPLGGGVQRLSGKEDQGRMSEQIHAGGS
jgi:drug/metabolite transporter (DMT)-like permease